MSDPSDTGSFMALSPAAKASIWVNLFERYSSRKFVLVMMIQIAAIVALFTRRMEPATWLAVASLVLSTYFASSIADKKLNGGTG